MSHGLLAAVLLQTFFIIAFISILLPFRYSPKKTFVILGVITLISCVFASLRVARYGSIYLMQNGYLLIGLPLFLALYLLSRARGIRFVFVFLTALIFDQILYVLLMVLRISEYGFTPFYFFMNFIAFGLLLAGGYYLRQDFHKILFTFSSEFKCLSPILILLLAISYLFSPIIGENTIDDDLLLITLVFDLLVFLLYLYIGVSFHSLGKHCHNAQKALSLQYQLEEARNRISLLQTSQENGGLHHQNFCQNESVNLLLGAFFAKAHKDQILLITDTQIPSSLPISTNEFCALLSNALENAITAAQGAESQQEKTIRLMVRLTEGKLLIFVENPYWGEVKIEDGLPLSNRKGHGFGVKSMESIVKKYGGLYTFEAKDQIFTVRIVI